jgi:hypothetical protein
MRRLRYVLWPAGLAFGLVAEWARRPAKFLAPPTAPTNMKPHTAPEYTRPGPEASRSVSHVYASYDSESAPPVGP